MDAGARRRRQPGGGPDRAPGSALAGTARGAGGRRCSRAQLPRPVPGAWRRRRGVARQGVLWPGARNRRRRDQRLGRRPRGWTGVRNVRSERGHAGRAGCTRSGGSPGSGACDDTDRVRVGGVVVRPLGTEPRRPCAHPLRRRRGGAGRDPTGAGRGSRGVRDRERAQAGISPLAGRAARLRQPLDEVRAGDTRSNGRRGRSRGGEQPDGRGFHRREPVVPGAGRPVRRVGRGGHPDGRGDDGGTARRLLLHPGARRSEDP